MSDEQRTINARVSAHVPTHAWDSTVAIVIATPPTVRLFGTGVLFQIADSPFLVTAGHIAHFAHTYRKTIGLGATGHERVIPIVSGGFTSSVPAQGMEDDPYDVAVYPIPPDMAEKLHRKRFLRIGDVSSDDPGPKAVFSVFGYPGVWCDPSIPAEERMDARAFEFTTYAYDGDTTTFTGYQPRLHLLLSAGTEYMTWPDGSTADFRDRKGQPVPFPRGLKGISGAGVWHVGDLAVPLDKWGACPARLVGVDTGVYHASGAITATRWAVVTTVIHKAFPDLRRSIELWMP